MDNAFAPPQSGTTKLPLTRLQRACLLMYQQHHGRPVRTLAMLALMWKQYLAIAVLVAVLLALHASDARDHAAQDYLLIGLVVGSVLNGLKTTRRFCHAWPALDAAMDQERIQDLLDHGLGRDAEKAAVG